MKRAEVRWHRFALDLCTQGAQALVDAFVSAVDLTDACPDVDDARYR